VQRFTAQLNFVRRSRKWGEHPMARLQAAGYFFSKVSNKN
jgi:hypothetical protein